MYDNVLMWRVEIRLMKAHGKVLAFIHEFFVLAADAERAKALALAEWGYGFRADKVISVFAEPAGVVARGDIFTTKKPKVEPDSIPNGAAIDDAVKFLEHAES